MTQQQPRLLSPCLVEVQLDNAILEDTLNERKQELLSHLRKQLSNYSIQFSITVQKAVLEQRAYLPEEKFKKLAEKNPNILKLQQDLDLDFVY